MENAGFHQIQCLPSEVASTSSDSSSKPQSEPQSSIPFQEPENSIGKTGTFDGEFVMMDTGKKFQVPPNYVSKSMLIEGDKLKLMKVGDFNEFKLMEQVERVEKQGILTKKDNQWVAFIDNNEYRIISAAVRFHKGEFGDKLTVLFPKGYEQTPPLWVAIKELTKSEENAKRQELEMSRADGVIAKKPWEIGKDTNQDNVELTPISPVSDASPPSTPSPVPVTTTVPGEAVASTGSTSSVVPTDPATQATPALDNLTKDDDFGVTDLR